MERIHVDTVQVGEGPMPQTLALNGTLRGERQTELAANASGRVLEKAGFAIVGVEDDEHDGATLRVNRWELVL